MAMLLNGRPYTYNDIQDFEHIKLNTIQLLEIFHAHGGSGGHGSGNKGAGTGMGHHQGGMTMMQGMRHGGNEHKEEGQVRGGGMGMMMTMAHPIHLHGQQFQIVSRSVNADQESDYATVQEGFINSGLKDTVLVMPGEKIRIIKPFQDFKGLFMYHCHNLEHEDMGMMRDFLIE
jgi:hypothetical protein